MILSRFEWLGKGLPVGLILLLLTLAACSNEPLPLEVTEFESAPTEAPEPTETTDTPEPTETAVPQVEVTAAPPPAQPSRVPPVVADPTPTQQPAPTAAPIDSTLKLPWETIGDRPVIDPKGKYWEKYEDGTSLIGLYLRMDDINSVGDFLELKSDGTFDLEVGGDLTTGKWQEEGATIILAPA